MGLRVSCVTTPRSATTPGLPAPPGVHRLALGLRLQPSGQPPERPLSEHLRGRQRRAAMAAARPGQPTTAPAAPVRPEPAPELLETTGRWDSAAVGPIATAARAAIEEQPALAVLSQANVRPELALRLLQQLDCGSS